ncbi:MAG: DUF2145 domain-containing protein [Syntrophobacteraceae bacterium]
MKHINHLIKILLIFVLVFGCYFAEAEGSSQSGGTTHFKPEEVTAFSKKVERTLAEKGARVALVARVGRPRDKLPRGMNFTHAGFAVYSQITVADGRQIPGYAMYNLYQSNEKPNASNLVQDYPLEFFAAVEVLEAGVIIPSPELQKRLLEVIASPVYQKLHNPKYSVIASPFTLELQNCTEYTLDVIMAAIYKTDDLKVIKANEKAYFEAQPVHVNPIKLAFGSMFSAEVALSDHQGPPVTATFETISRFLKKYDNATEILTITPDSGRTNMFGSM